jgi:glycosyltransferase involved in cell wall biosynthesis/trans-aconitate methyltransferase
MDRARLTLVGHPFAPLGMGEHLRATFRALRAVGADVVVRDVWGNAGGSGFDAADALRAHLVPAIDSDVTIFVLNGDEREPAFRHLGDEIGRAGHKVVYPAWELPRYPEPWARELEHYDEVWAASRYSRDAFATAVRRPIHHLPLPCQPPMTRQLSRRHFGISETAYAFLFLFDLTSYIERKNPFDLLSAFRKLRAARPFADVQLVLKVSNKGADPAGFERLAAALEPIRRHVVVIDRTLADNEVKSLVRVSDAFVSLHRAEGFGFGLGEAMYYEKPVIATGYSGNMDYMTPDTALLVGHSLVPVGEGQYPHATGQVWAQPDVDEAVRHMIRLVDDPGAGRELGARASTHVRTHFSLRACGLRYLERLEAAAGASVGASIALPALAPVARPPATASSPPQRAPGEVGKRVLARLERVAREEPPEKVFAALRALSLREVGELLLDVPESCPALRAVLPTMPGDDVQRGWTGNSGAALLEQSLSFVEEVSAGFESLTGRPLEGARILDYGCGWGRLIRLMYKFSGPETIYGCDAWETSLDLSRSHAIRAQLALCDEVPTAAPFPGVTFDLIYAFSVLTHLSERTARAVMDALRSSIAPDGVCVVTIRPPEYWDAAAHSENPPDVARMKRDHATRGFAFTPHQRAAVDGEISYGDASISLEYIARSWSGWSIAADRLKSVDPLQHLVFLRPV